MTKLVPIGKRSKFLLTEYIYVCAIFISNTNWQLPCFLLTEKENKEAGLEIAFVENKIFWGYFKPYF